jgi:DNA polymerase-4
MLRMSESLGRRLRKDELACQTVRIKVRWPDFTTITRQNKLSNPTHVDGEIFLAAQALFKSIWGPGRKVRLLGVGVADLGPQVRQLELFDQSWEQDERLMQAIDTIRERYGRDAVKRAGTMQSDR